MDLKKKSLFLILMFFSIIIIAASAQLVIPKIQAPGTSPSGLAIVNSPSVTTPPIISSENSEVAVSKSEDNEIS